MLTAVFRLHLFDPNYDGFNPAASPSDPPCTVCMGLGMEQERLSVSDVNLNVFMDLALELLTKIALE